MQIKELINWSFFVFLTVPLGILSCSECNDCGPSTAEPYVSFKFFNMDSLNKVEDTLVVLQDSLDKIIIGIDTGNNDLDTIRSVLEATIDEYSQIETDIKNGKLKIDEVYGPNGEGPIFFRDSTTNDSLTIFSFPLDMNHDSCSYIIRINDMEDEVGVAYRRELDKVGNRIIVRIYDLELTSYTYDSAKVFCDQSSCISNETKIYSYF